MTTATTIEVHPAAFDLAMMRYLPASVNELRAVVHERTGVDYPNAHTVTELLAVLARLDGI